MGSCRLGGHGIGRWVAVALVVCGLLLAGCARGGRDLPDVGLDLVLEPSPPRIGPATVSLTLSVFPTGGRGNTV